MINIDYLPTKSSKGKCALLVGLISCLYLLENSPMVTLIGSQVFTYVIKPILWMGTALVVWRFPRVRNKAKLKLASSINGWAFVFAVIFIAVSFIVGIFDGLGKSPYNHSIKGIIINLILVGSVLVGKELVRSYLVNSLTEKENYIIFILIALFMTFIGISFNRIMELKGLEGIVKFTAQYFAPELSHNLLAVYLAFLGGPVASITYMGVIQAYHWFSPILPDLQWLTTALIGVMCPIFALSAMQSIYLKESKKLRKQDKDEESVISWMITSLFSIGIIWFAVGVFPIYPSVIATGSMEPMIKPGDVILVKKLTDISQVEVGDVVQFRRGGILISHRIIEIKESNKDGISYRTQGDNNTGADTELVKPEDLKGEVVKVVPKIGWPTLLIKSDKDIDLKKIVF